MLNKAKKGIEEYTNESTVHGLKYVFDRKIGLFDRLLWLVIVLCSMFMAIWMIGSSYSSWQQKMVITTLKTTAKPITDLDFPTVTICADGQHMGMVEKVVYNHFNKWKKEKYKSKHLPVDDKTKEEFSQFMKDMFQIDEEGINVMDMLNTMIAPQAAGTNEIRQNEQACAEKIKRNKREVKLHDSVASIPSKRFTIRPL